MTNYRAILLYHSKGNTTTQIATICQCSRTTVIKTIKRAQEKKLMLPVSPKITDKQLYFILYPRRGRKQEYFLPDWRELDRDMLKRSFSKFRAWQKYCRVAKKLGLKAYGKTHFYNLFYNYFHAYKMEQKGKGSWVLDKIRYFELGIEMIAQNYGMESNQYKQFFDERESWCKELRLNKSRIWAI